MKKKFWDFVSVIKNGQLANKLTVKYMKKKNCEKLLNILWDEGYILGYRTSKTNQSVMIVYLKYNNNLPSINKIKIISKSSLKIHYSVKQLWKLKENQSLTILSTNKGLLSLNSCKKLGIGGEPILTVK